MGDEALDEYGHGMPCPYTHDLRRDLAAYVRESRGRGMEDAMKGLEGFFKRRSKTSGTAFQAWLAAPLFMALLAGMADGAEAARPGSTANGGSETAWATHASPLHPRPFTGAGAGAADITANAERDDRSGPSPVRPGESRATHASPLQLGFDVKPEAALDWFREREIVDAETFGLLDGAAKARAFAIGELTDRYALDVVKGSLEQAMADGLPVNEWLNGLGETVAKAGLSEVADLGAWHLRLVWRQNCYLAYGAGRFVQMKRVADARPWWQYLSQLDDDTRPSHRALHGVIRRHDDPFWSKYYPPWAFACRCMVVSVDPAEMEAEGLTPTDDAAVAARYAQLAPGAGAFPAPKPGFAYDPAEAFFLNKGVAGMMETAAGRAAHNHFLRPFRSFGVEEGTPADLGLAISPAPKGTPPLLGSEVRKAARELDANLHVSAKRIVALPGYDRNEPLRSAFVLPREPDAIYVCNTPKRDEFYRGNRGRVAKLDKAGLLEPRMRQALRRADRLEERLGERLAAVTQDLAHEEAHVRLNRLFPRKGKDTAERMLRGPELAEYRAMLSRAGIGVGDAHDLAEIMADDLRVVTVGGYPNLRTWGYDGQNQGAALDRAEWVKRFLSRKSALRPAGRES